MTKALCIVWIQSACLLTIAVGLIAAFASAPATAEAWRFLFDVLRWPLDGDPAGFSSEAMALNAISGGLMVGWGTLMLLVIRSRVAQHDAPLLTALVAGVLAWFVVDSTGSLAAGLPGNLVLNASFLLLYLPPLIRLRRLAPLSP